MLGAPSAIQVLVNGVESTEATISVEDYPKLPSTVVTLPAITALESSIALELGPNPLLSVLNHTSAISAMLEDFQLEIFTKNDIWEVVRASQPVTVKVGRLLSLGLEDVLVGPLVELLLSDSRAEYGGCCSKLDAMNHPDSSS